jgi:hypothetical protein
MVLHFFSTGINYKFKIMYKIIVFVISSTLLLACSTPTAEDEKIKAKMDIMGTWELLSGTLIEKGDTVVTDYTNGQKMIKIINETHFAFLRHDLSKGKDSAIYSSGGGRYTYTGDQYTEHLDFCDAREWEGNTFNFTISFSSDTLIQSGIEKIDSLGINRLNIEKYVKVKP